VLTSPDEDHVSFKAGAARVNITPPLPVDLLGYVRRARAARGVWDPLLATACVMRGDDGATVAVIAADVVGLTTEMSDRIRARVAAAISCRPEEVLLNSSHSHASLWPGATMKLGGEFDGWTETELRWWESVPDLYASAAVQAAESALEARVSAGVGQVHQVAVNRRERTADGRTILGWNPDGFIDESVPTLRIDELGAPPDKPAALATIVGFGCHPVVVGPDVPLVSSDFVGPLRDMLDSRLRPGGVTLFLQGAAGNVLPLEAFGEEAAAAKGVGERIALEAAHAVADRDPRELVVERLEYGSVTPIGLYRRRLAVAQPEPALRSVRRIVRLPLLAAPPVEDLERELAERRADLARRANAGEGRETMNPVRYHISWLELMLATARHGPLPTAIDGEIWASRLGDAAIVGAPGEIFGEIGAAVRSASPSPVTLFAGYCNGSLGYVATPEEYRFGGYEPAVSHRGYGHPAPFSPDVAGILRDTARELLGELFPEGPVADRLPALRPPTH
jgi:neutral ceramidase